MSSSLNLMFSIVKSSFTCKDCSRGRGQGVTNTNKKYGGGGQGFDDVSKLDKKNIIFCTF